MGVERSSDRILDHVTQGAAPVIALIAPAGFGKTRLALAIAAKFERQALVSMDGQMTALEAVCALLGSDAESVDAGCKRLRDSDTPTCVLVDSIERSKDDVALELLTALTRFRQESGVVVLCSRREPLQFQFADLVGPHLLAAFRRPDLELSVGELKSMIPAGANVPMATIYGIYALTRGWPVPTISLLAASARGAFEADGFKHDHPVLRDLLDWVDKNAIQGLPEEVREVLLHCIACRDSVPSDFDRFGNDPLRADLRLYRNSQCADIGFAGEIRVHPLIAFTVQARNASGLERCAHEAAANFLNQNEPLRAARAMVSIGDLKRAADIVNDIGVDAARDLAGFPYPGLALEHYQRTKPAFERYPLLWLNLVPCRSYVVPARTLAREGASILRENADMLEPRLVRWITAITAMLFVESGDLASAERYASILREHGGAEEAMESLGIVELYLDVACGRYNSALERWQGLGAYLRSSPVWHDLHLRCWVRAEARLGNLDAGIDALRAQLSSIRMGGCPSIAGFGAMEAAWLSWYRGDDADFRRYRREFANIAQHYDIPGLWRSLCALFGEDLDDGTAPVEHHDVLSALVLAADAPDPDRGRTLAARAVETADRGRDAALRIVARVIAAARSAPNAESLLVEAAALAGGMDSQPMKDSLSAYRAGKADIGYLQQHIDHVRRATSREIAPKPPSDMLTIDVATAEIYRSTTIIRVSEGAAQLVILLAANGTTSREAIVDRMWPDLDGDAAANALKMCLHRARIQMGDPKVLEVHKGAYSLGNNVESNYLHILDCAARGTVPLSREQKTEFADLFDRLTRGIASGRASWPWFQPFASALQDAMRRLGECLSEDDLDHGDPQMALQVARRMASVDPFDETARALVIRAYGKSGNWTAAIHEFREFSEALKRDMGAEPSDRLKRLLNAS